MADPTDLIGNAKTSMASGDSAVALIDGVLTAAIELAGGLINHLSPH